MTTSIAYLSLEQGAHSLLDLCAAITEARKYFCVNNNLNRYIVRLGVEATQIQDILYLLENYTDPSLLGLCALDTHFDISKYPNLKEIATVLGFNPSTLGALLSSADMRNIISRHVPDLVKQTATIQDNRSLYEQLLQ